MKLGKLLLTVCALCVLSGCGYDDEELWNKVNDHETRISALEKWQTQTNNNISALEVLINTNDYITSVEPAMEDGVEVGYTITFSSREPITLYHGKNGAQGAAGVTPVISLTKLDDGDWYWTVNGSLMKDDKGNPIRANGHDGKDGQDGEDGQDGSDGWSGSDGADGKPGAPGTSAPTPQILLGSNLPEGAVIGDKSEVDSTAFYLSVDGGKTWYRISGEKGDTGDPGATGADNQGIEVTINDKYVTFTLESGEEFNVPYYDEDAEEGLAAGFMIYDKDDETTLENNDAIEIEIINPDQYKVEQLYFKYPEGLKKEDISGVIAEVIGQTGDNLSNDPDKNFATRANTDDDKKIGVFVETNDQLGYYMYIKHQGMSTGDTYMIRATLIKNDGSTLVTARAVRFMTYMKVGDILYSDGSFSTKRDDSKTPIGIIFYLGEDRIGQAEKEVLAQKGVTKPRGLAIALSDATIKGNILYHNASGVTGHDVEVDNRFLWCLGNENSKDEMVSDETGLTNCSDGDATTCYKDISGLANCNYIWNGSGAYTDLEKYPAFNAAKKYADAHNDEIDFATTG